MVGVARYQPGRKEDRVRRGRRRRWTELHRISARYRWVASGTPWRGRLDGHLARWKMGDHETGEGRTAEPGADGSGRGKATHTRCRKLQRSSVSARRQAVAGLGNCSRARWARLP